MAARKTQTTKKVARKTSLAKSTKKATAKQSPVKKVIRKAVKTVKALKKPLKKAIRKTQTKLSLVKPSPVSVGKKPFTKGQLLSAISEQTGVSRKEVELVLSTTTKVIHAHLKKGGPECFTWPGVLKIIVVKKPAVAARWGTNPFTGDKMQFKAKPASRKVKVRPLKGLKEMAV